MERYESLFAQLKERKEGAFVPFVTLGDPGIEQSLKIIDTLIEAGQDILAFGDEQAIEEMFLDDLPLLDDRGEVDPLVPIPKQFRI